MKILFILNCVLSSEYSYASVVQCGYLFDIGIDVNSIDIYKNPLKHRLIKFAKYVSNVKKLSRIDRLQNLISRLPYFYLLPIPKFIKPLETKKVEQAKLKYIQVIANIIENKNISKNSDSYDDNQSIVKYTHTDASTLQTIEPPKSNEEKVALLEAIEVVFWRELENESDNKSIIAHVRQMEQKRLLTLLSGWKYENGITQETFKQIMDLHYLASNSSAYSIKKLGNILHPSPEIYRIIRERWEAELKRSDFISALKNLNLLSASESKWEKIKNKLGVFFYWTNNALLNVTSFMTFNFPMFFPEFNTIKLINTKADATHDYSAFYQKAKFYAGFDYFSKWTARIYVFIVAGVIALYGVNTAANMHYKRTQYEQSGMVTLQNLVTREQLEKLIQQEMIREYNIIHKTAPSNQKIEEFKEQIQNMRLQELANFLKQIKQIK